MSSVKQQVVALIHDYQATVYQAVALLNAKAEQQRGFQMQRTWYLDDLKQLRYSFHGAGCLVTTPTFTVDFDYATEGGCSGIDSWFLACFLESNSAMQAKYPLLTSREQVKQVLPKLVKEGLLTQYVYADHDGRYYWPVDSQRVNPPTLRLHLPDENASE
jgi:hypothetical protein